MPLHIGAITRCHLARVWASYSSSVVWTFELEIGQRTVSVYLLPLHIAILRRWSLVVEVASTCAGDFKSTRSCQSTHEFVCFSMCKPLGSGRYLSLYVTSEHDNLNLRLPLGRAENRSTKGMIRFVGYGMRLRTIHIRPYNTLATYYVAKVLYD